MTVKSLTSSSLCVSKDFAFGLLPLVYQTFLFVNTEAFVFVERRVLAEPVLYFVLGFLGSLGGVHEVIDRAALDVGIERRVVGEVAADSTHLGEVRHGGADNFAHHIHRMHALHDYFRSEEHTSEL